MNRERQFLDDLNAFAKRGAIGEPDAIMVTPPVPTLGTLFMVRCVGATHGRLVSTDGREWPVRDGQRISILAAGPIGLTYCDGDDAIATVMVTPAIETPRLLNWRLSSGIETICSTVRVAPQLENAEQAQVRWQAPGQEWSQPAELPADIPLPGVAGELKLQLTIRSRHAHVSAKGTLVHSHSIKIVPPAPRVVFDLPARVYLGDSLQIRARFQWVRRAVLRCGEHAEEIGLADPSKLAELTLPAFDASALGHLKVQLDLRGLDGEAIVREHLIEVLPREAASRRAG